MTTIDHFFVFGIAIVFPIASFISFRRLLARIAKGEKFKRSELYTSTALSLWGIFAATIALWTFSNRSWADLGINLQLDGAFVFAALLTVAGIVALYLQRRHVMSGDRETLNGYRDQLGTMDVFLPRNGNELGRFYGVSLTAGIVEEVVWRGFLIWYLSFYMPVWAAAVVSSIGFGLAHAYQGIRNVPQVTLVGGVFALLFVISGSVWLPMILHAAVDMFQGRLAYDVVNLTNGDQAPPNDAPAAVSA